VRVATTVSGLTTTLDYQYDHLDRLIRRTVNGQEATEYRYDRASRLTAIVFKRPGHPDEITDYTWDAASRLTQKTLPNGIRQVLSYDEANRLTRIQYLRTDTSILETIDYAYDPNGNRILKSLSTASVPETPFTALYDEANRITQVTLRPGTVQAKTYALSYDENGNLTTKQNTADAADTTTYSWDARDRLIAIQAPGITASFAYDALGRRLERTVNGETTRYVYDGIQAIGEIRGSETTTLVTGLVIDEMIARYSTQGQRVFLTDALGSVIAQARQDHSIVNWYGYSPYGETVATADDEGNAVEYTARDNDGTGLYFYRSRYYDPMLKRWISEDPIGLAAGPNVYAYADAAPTTYTDPLGLWEWGDPLPQGLVDFTAGFGDHLSFGLTNVVREATGLNGVVNKCDGLYAAGRKSALAMEIGLLGASAGLKALARLKPTTVARAEQRRWVGGGTVETPIHHQLPLYGHPGGVPTIFPSAGLPGWVHSAPWAGNVVRVSRADHIAAHRALRQWEERFNAIYNWPFAGARTAVDKLSCGCQ
jgi:RHS repeat-associated protein